MEKNYLFTFCVKKDTLIIMIPINRQLFIFSGLSILQNGKIPVFINELEDQIFSFALTHSECINNLRTGLDWLGLYTVRTPNDLLI